MKAKTISKARVAPLAFVFVSVGVLAFLAVLIALWNQPGLLLGDPYRPAALLLAHGVAVGFAASVLFGASYLILPVMAATPLWSVRLGWLHAGTHLIGVALLALSLAGMAWLHPFYGLAVLSIGYIAFSGNLMLTASRLNRWDPALLTVFFALCWLALVAGLSLWLIFEQAAGDPRPYTAALLEGQALVALVGFFWLFLLGAALKILSMFLVSKMLPGPWTWLGLVLLNAALFWIPLGTMLRFEVTLPAGLLILAGSLCYGVDYLRLAWGSKRMWSGDLLTATAALLLGVPLIAWAVAGMPLFVDVETLLWQEQARAYFAMGLLGCMALATFGLGMRVVPFLVWQIRFLPLVGREPVPAAESLIRMPARSAVFVCQLLGWMYLAAGQLWQNPVGTQLAVVCFVVGTLWAFVAILPALKCLLRKPAKP